MNADEPRFESEVSDAMAADRADGEPALVVDVEGFEGPLDLLLALARQQKVDLAKISILALVEQYLAVIEGARKVRLELARELGDALIVGLNSDAGVRQLKGAGRPVIPERERAEILAALECVDAVVIFDDATPREVISRLLPDVLVKGGDWPGDQIVGREEVEAAGGRVVSVPVVPGYSTTAILKKIREEARTSRAES